MTRPRNGAVTAALFAEEHDVVVARVDEHVTGRHVGMSKKIDDVLKPRVEELTRLIWGGTHGDRTVRRER